LLDTEMCSAVQAHTDRSAPVELERLQIASDSSKGKSRAEHRKECDQIQEQYFTELRANESAKKRLFENSFGIGAALTRLGPSSDRLTTALKYLRHHERAAREIVHDLLALRKERAATVEMAIQPNHRPAGHSSRSATTAGSNLEARPQPRRDKWGGERRIG